MTKAETKVCEGCGKSYCYVKKHLASAYHQAWEKNQNKTEVADTEDAETTATDGTENDNDSLEENAEDENIHFEVLEEDTFLTDLQTDNYISEETYLERDLLLKKQNDEEFLARKRELALEKEEVKIQQMRNKALKQAARPVKEPKEPTFVADDNDALFSEKPTPILGLDRRVLIKKINQYKMLFTEVPEVKKFRIKKNSTVEDLEVALQEIQAIIETSSIDEFITDALFSSIQVAEGITKAHAKRYDISGLSQSLKNNPQFISLVKQLYLRYSSFAAIPAEYQVCLIIATTSWICIQKNNQKKIIDSFLDEPAVV